MQETWVQLLGQEDPLERKWQPTPVFLPGEFCGQSCLLGCSPWNRKESDTTEGLNNRCSSRHPTIIQQPFTSTGSAPTNSEPADTECRSPAPFDNNYLSTGRLRYLWGLLEPIPCRYAVTAVCSVNPFPSNLVQKFLKTLLSHESALCVCALHRFATAWSVARQLLCPWDSPGGNTGVGCHALLQGIFPIRGWNPSLLYLLHWQVDSVLLNHQESPHLSVVKSDLFVFCIFHQKFHKGKRTAFSVLGFSSNSKDKRLVQSAPVLTEQMTYLFRNKLLFL